MTKDIIHCYIIYTIHLFFVLKNMNIYLYSSKLYFLAILPIFLKDFGCFLPPNATSPLIGREGKTFWSGFKKDITIGCFFGESSFPVKAKEGSVVEIGVVILLAGPLEMG